MSAFIAATGPIIQGWLTNSVFHGNLRYGGMTMCAVFLLGLFRPSLRS